MRREKNDPCNEITYPIKENTMPKQLKIFVALLGVLGVVFLAKQVRAHQAG